MMPDLLTIAVAAVTAHTQHIGGRQPRGFLVEWFRHEDGHVFAEPSPLEPVTIDVTAEPGTPNAWWQTDRGVEALMAVDA